MITWLGLLFALMLLLVRVSTGNTLPVGLCYSRRLIHNEPTNLVVMVSNIAFA